MRKGHFIAILLLLTASLACSPKGGFSPSGAYTAILIGDTADQVRSKIGTPFTTLGNNPETWVYGGLDSTDSLRVLIVADKVVDVCIDKDGPAGTQTTCKGTIGK